MRALFVALITFCAFVTFSVNAQSGRNENESRFGFGIKAGLVYGNTISINTNYKYDETAGLSYTGGVYGTVKLTSFFSVQPELIYTNLRFTINNLDYTDENGNQLYSTTTKRRLEYIQLPVLAKFTIPKTGISITPGIQVGYLLGAKEDIGSYKDIDIKPIYKNLDIGPVFGVEYQFASGVQVAFKKGFGILNISKEKLYGMIELPTATYLTVGYRFR